MKKILLSLMLVAGAFTLTNAAPLNNLTSNQEVVNWQLLPAQGANKHLLIYKGGKNVELTFHVNKYVSGDESISADTVYLVCGNQGYHVEAGTTVVCKPSSAVFGIIASIDHFKHGAEGNYTLVTG